MVSPANLSLTNSVVVNGKATTEWKGGRRRLAGADTSEAWDRGMIGRSNEKCIGLVSGCHSDLNGLLMNAVRSLCRDCCLLTCKGVKCEAQCTGVVEILQARFSRRER